MARDTRRLGILTSGGDCPGLNAVIRGAVKTAERHGIETVGFIKGYEGLVDPVTYVPLNSRNTSGILNQGGTILSSTNKGRFAARIGIDDRLDLDPKLLAGVEKTCEQLALEGLICVGGDGSLAVAQQFHEYGIPVVGVPKTIDNDLSATAFTFGFDSAVACATDALDRLHTTAASHERIMVLEVMGRHAGWIALYAGIAGGGDVILIPEISWTYEGVCAKILAREKLGKRFTLIVVAEGSELPDGDTVTQERRQETRQTRLGGIGNVVAFEIEQRLGRESRVVVLGHLQRGGPPTTFDRVLATQFGTHAVRLIIEGRFGEMVCYNPPAVESVPIIEAVNQLSRVENDSSVVQAARALGISFGDASSTDGPFSRSPIVRPKATPPQVIGTLKATSLTAESPATEPAVTEPAATEPAASEPAASERAATEPVAIERAASERAATEPVAIERAATEPVATEPVAIVTPATERVATERAATERVATERAGTERAAIEPRATELRTTEPAKASVAMASGAPSGPEPTTDASAPDVPLEWAIAAAYKESHVG